MGIELIFLGVALVAVGLTRGSYKQLLKTRFHHWWALALVFIGNAVVEFAPIPKDQYDTVGFGLVLATYVLLFGFCCTNLNLKAMWIVIVGIASNALVIGLNEGMPVTTSGGYTVPESMKYQAATSSDLLPWLGAIFPIDVLSIAISVGDIILGIGLVFVCTFASRKNKNAEKKVEPVDTAEMIDTAFEEYDDIPPEMTVVGKSNDEAYVYIDLTSHEEAEKEAAKPVEQPAEVVPQPMMSSSRGPGARKSSEKRAEKAERVAGKRSHKKWQKNHGLAALPSKEDLGYDEDSMEIVDIAQ